MQPQGRGNLPMSKTPIFFITLLIAVLAYGLYLLFAASISFDELLLGVICAAVSIALNVLAWRSMEIDFRPTLRHVLALWRLPWYVLSDTWQVTAALARDLAGRRARSSFRITPFRVNRAREGDAQVVLTTAYASASPNMIVIGACDSKLLFHQIEPTGVPLMITDLEAES